MGNIICKTANIVSTDPDPGTIETNFEPQLTELQKVYVNIEAEYKTLMENLKINRERLRYTIEDFDIAAKNLGTQPAEQTKFEDIFYTTLLKQPEYNEHNRHNALKDPNLELYLYQCNTQTLCRTKQRLEKYHNYLLNIKKYINPLSKDYTIEPKPGGKDFGFVLRSNISDAEPRKFIKLYPIEKAYAVYDQIMLHQALGTQGIPNIQLIQKDDILILQTDEVQTQRSANSMTVQELLATPPKTESSIDVESKSTAPIPNKTSAYLQLWKFMVKSLAIGAKDVRQDNIVDNTIVDGMNLLDKRYDNYYSTLTKRDADILTSDKNTDTLISDDDVNLYLQNTLAHFQKKDLSEPDEENLTPEHYAKIPEIISLLKTLLEMDNAKPTTGIIKRFLLASCDDIEQTKRPTHISAIAIAALYSFTKASNFDPIEMQNTIENNIPNIPEDIFQNIAEVTNTVTQFSQNPTLANAPAEYRTLFTQNVSKQSNALNKFVMQHTTGLSEKATTEANTIQHAQIESQHTPCVNSTPNHANLSLPNAFPTPQKEQVTIE